MIEQATIDDILARLDLPQYVGEHVALVDKGERALGLCPFHQESSPSFMVYPTHYHCYGCGAHGNAINFAMNHLGMSFMDALRSLSSMTGVPLNQTAPLPNRARPVEEALGRAAGLYAGELNQPHGEQARRELANRGTDMDLVLRFGIGYAPAAATYLMQNGIDQPSLERAGLVSPGRNGQPRCYFRDRLMFPIRDLDGTIIGFGARQLDKADEPKYLNSPESMLYQKRRVLYGIHEAQRAIRKANQVIIGEGYFDVLTPAQHEIENVVATCGTALTVQQLELLASLADDLVFCFDDDAAGHKASLVAARMCLTLLNDYQQARICMMPQGHDPDSFVREHGREAFLVRVRDALPASLFVIEHLERSAQSPEARAKAFCEGHALRASISAPALGLFFEQCLCERFGIAPGEVQLLLPQGPVTVPDGEVQLRPCPCCGGSAQTIRSALGYRVECLFGCLSTPNTSDSNQCQNLWNRRFSPRIRRSPITPPPPKPLAA